MEKTIEVLGWRLGEAKAFLDKMVQKSTKYGVDFSYSIGQPFEDVRHREAWDGEIREIKVPIYPVTFTAEAPKAGEYEFLAHLEVTKDGVFCDAVPGVTDLDVRFRNTDNTCQHCYMERNRKDLYVVRGVDGKQLQIGRSCLQDYLGVDPERIVNRFTMFKQIREFDEDMPRFSGGGFYHDQLELLQMTAVAIRLWGWLSKGAANEANRVEDATSTKVERCIGFATDPESCRIRNEMLRNLTAEDREMAEKVLNWVRTEMNDRNDYTHNLKVAMTPDYVTDAKRLGLVVSAVSAYQREMEHRKAKEEAAQGSVSKSQGNIGERLRGLNVTVTLVRVIPSDMGFDSVLIKFRDDVGNVFTWFTSETRMLQADDKVTIDGTVKAHNIYQDQHETLLSRCKIKE